MSEALNDAVNTPLHALEILPPDTVQPYDSFAGETESEIIAWAADVRHAFGKNRQQFNMAVCDALARSGTTPTPGTVLRISKWGHHTSVAADVAQWMRGLTQRFTQLESDVPLPARQLANELIAKLFSLSREEAQKAAGVQVQVLREKFDALSVEHDEALKRESSLQDEIQAKDEKWSERELVVQQLQMDIQGLKDVIDWAQAKINQADVLKIALEAAAIDKEREHAAAIAAAQASAIEVQAAAAAALQQTQQAADAERRRLMQKLDDQRTLDLAAQKELRSDLSTVKSKLEGCQAELHTCRVLLAKETLLREAATNRLSTESAHWEAERTRLQSSDERHRALILFTVNHHSMGFKITRDPAMDIKTILCERMGMSPENAEIVIQQTRAVELETTGKLGS